MVVMKDLMKNRKLSKKQEQDIKLGTENSHVIGRKYKHLWENADREKTGDGKQLWKDGNWQAEGRWIIMLHSSCTSNFPNEKKPTQTNNLNALRSLISH